MINEKIMDMMNYHTKNADGIKKDFPSTNETSSATVDLQYPLNIVHFAILTIKKAE